MHRPEGTSLKSQGAGVDSPPPAAPQSPMPAVSHTEVQAVLKFYAGSVVPHGTWEPCTCSPLHRAVGTNLNCCGGEVDSPCLPAEPHACSPTCRAGATSFEVLHGGNALLRRTSTLLAKAELPVARTPGSLWSKPPLHGQSPALATVVGHGPICTTGKAPLQSQSLCFKIQQRFGEMGCC